VLGRIRRRLASLARGRGRDDLAALLEMPASERVEQGGAADRSIEVLRTLPIPRPAITEDIGRWSPARVVAALRAYGIKTLAALTVRVPRRRRLVDGHSQPRRHQRKANRDVLFSGTSSLPGAPARDSCGSSAAASCRGEEFVLP